MGKKEQEELLYVHQSGAKIHVVQFEIPTLNTEDQLMLHLYVRILRYHRVYAVMFDHWYGKDADTCLGTRCTELKNFALIIIIVNFFLIQHTLFHSKWIIVSFFFLVHDSLSCNCLG